jgi:hypothetical protein
MALSKYKFTGEVLGGPTELYSILRKETIYLDDRITDEQAEYLFNRKSPYVELAKPETAKNTLPADTAK